jgi:hypothetical protein|tara:strand:+ start:854 stop:1672 length:819 start_codon:yes stop_codon:yes gene_type:complete
MNLFLIRVAKYGLIAMIMTLLLVLFYDIQIFQQKDEYKKFYSYSCEKKIVLGSSHSMPIKPDGFYNFGSGSQTLDTSEMILRDCLNKTTLDNLILVISPFSMHFDQIHYSNLLQNFPQTNENIIIRFFKDNTKLLVIQNWIKFKIFNISDFNPLEKTHASFSNRAKRSIQHINLNTEFDGLDNFDNIIQLCSENDIDLKVIIPPYTEEYLNFINSWGFWKSDLDLLKARELINVVDIQEYFHNEDNIYQFFLDPDHLNEKGEEIINDFLTTN